MGQPVTVVLKPSTRPDVVRIEINRSLTGMAGERYDRETEIVDDRPPDVLAERLLAVDGVTSLHINSNVITVVTDGSDVAERLREITEELFIYYRDGVAPEPVGATADG